MIWRPLPGVGAGLAATVVAVAASAGEPAWHVFGGGFAFQWLTDGTHGHTEYCPEPECDAADWQRANLDNAIGWRLGADRSAASFGRLDLRAGGELDLIFSEYNQSQRNFTLGAAFIAGGATLDLGALRPLLRLGAGGMTGAGGRSGVATFVEAGVDVVLSPRSALRLAARRSDLGGPRVDDLSLLVVAAPGDSTDWSRWELGWAWGGSSPGGLAGHDLELSRAPLWQVGAYRGVGRHGDRLGVELGATAHESQLYSSLGDVPGNQRGRWVVDLGARWDRVFAKERRWRWRLGAGAKVAGWRDDGPLLVGGDGERVRGGTELGVTAGAGTDVRLAEGLRLTTGLEQVYWPGIRLGEARLLVGLEVSVGDEAAAPAPETPPQAEGLEEQGFGKRLLTDLGALAARPAHLDGRDWRNLGLAALAVGGTMALDSEIRDVVQRNRSASGDDVAKAIRPVGNLTGPALLLGGLWAGGALGGNPTLAAIGRDGVEASLFSVVLITPALKELVGRARPDEGLGSTTVDPFSSYQSFPSGEATQVFTIASVVAAHTENPWVEGVAWGVAGLIGLERIYLDRHWASDVVAGALIGTGVGHWVAMRHLRTTQNHTVAWVVVPMVGHGGAGVVGSVSF